MNSRTSLRTLLEEVKGQLAEIYYLSHGIE